MITLLEVVLNIRDVNFLLDGCPSGSGIIA